MKPSEFTKTENTPDAVPILDRLDEFDAIIDVRSPAEFAIDHIPDAKSHPVLDNEERARVGTLDKQASPFEARKVGAALASRNIARHLEQCFAAKPREWRPLVYCWRGGQRSGSMAHVLRAIGWKAETLPGGYKAYRRRVLEDLETLPGQFRFQVICGATGSAKSRLLEALAREGAQVLDLEALAKHKGSVLGGIPGEPQPGQKWFESQIWNAFRSFRTNLPIWVESESRKIGVLQVPTTLLSTMRASPCMRLEAPVEARVEFLMRDYDYMLAQPQGLKDRLAKLTALQSREVIERWSAMIDAREWDALVTDLLVNHYDPLYQKSMGRSYPTLSQSPLVHAEHLAPDGIEKLARQLIAQSPFV